MYIFGICFILYFIKVSSGQGLNAISTLKTVIRDRFLFLFFYYSPLLNRTFYYEL